MNSILRRFKERLLQFDCEEGLELWILASGIRKEECDGIYEHLKKNNYKMTFTTGGDNDRKEVKPTVVFPFGPDDRQWDSLRVEGKGLSVEMDFPKYDENLCFVLSPGDFRNIKAVKALVNLMKGISDLHHWNMEIRSDSSEAPLARVFGGEDIIEFYSKPDTCWVKPNGSLKAWKPE